MKTLMRILLSLMIFFSGSAHAEHMLTKVAEKAAIAAVANAVMPGKVLNQTHEALGGNANAEDAKGDLGGPKAFVVKNWSTRTDFTYTVMVRKSYLGRLDAGGGTHASFTVEVVVEIEEKGEDKWVVTSREVQPDTVKIFREEN